MVSMVRIGKHSSNDIVVNDRLSEEFHCVIYLNEGQLRLIDQNSRFGTLVNGQKVRDIELSPGDVIQIGFAKIDWESKCLVSENVVYDGHASEPHAELEMEEPVVTEHETTVSTIEQTPIFSGVIPEKYLLDAKVTLISEWNKNQLESELDYEARPFEKPEELQDSISTLTQEIQPELCKPEKLDAQDEQPNDEITSGSSNIPVPLKLSQVTLYLILTLIILGMTCLGWLVAYAAQ